MEKGFLRMSTALCTTIRLIIPVCNKLCSNQLVNFALEVFFFDSGNLKELSRAASELEYLWRSRHSNSECSYLWSIYI